MLQKLIGKRQVPTDRPEKVKYDGRIIPAGSTVSIWPPDRVEFIPAGTIDVYYPAGTASTVAGGSKHNDAGYIRQVLGNSVVVTCSYCRRPNPYTNGVCEGCGGPL